jgi:hypothetical protein
VLTEISVTLPDKVAWVAFGEALNTMGTLSPVRRQNPLYHRAKSRWRADGARSCSVLERGSPSWFRSSYWRCLADW